jgi:hypothetical protein
MGSCCCWRCWRSCPCPCAETDDDSLASDSPLAVVDTVLVGKRTPNGAYQCIVYFPSLTQPMNATLRFRNVSSYHAFHPGDFVRITGLYERNPAGEYLVDIVGT